MRRRERGNGRVYLVGAGPGDPRLITRRGEELLAQADSVIYDRLVSPELLKRARPGCEKLYAGKEPDEGGRGQGRINRWMVERARAGKKVIRLKGGDPMVFGRVAEEMDALNAAGVPFEIVPGVSSAWAAAAAMQVPLTHRRVSSSVAFVTGHEAAGKAPRVRWEKLARGVDTLVILMGGAALPGIFRRLRRLHPASTPVALVRWVSTPQQEFLVSTLGRVKEDLKQRPHLGPPLLVIVGKVVRQAAASAGGQPLRGGWRQGKRHHAPLRGGWRQGKRHHAPLRGRKILLTRPAGENEGLRRRLEGLGARCRVLPTIRIRPRRLTAQEAQQLLARLPAYDWVIFNSHHGVEALDRLARRCRRSLARLVRGRVCAIGPRTREAASEAGLKVDLVPGDFSTEGVRRALSGPAVRGRKVLIPRSSLAVGDGLARSLRRQGAQVDEEALYETLPVKIPASRLQRTLQRLDAVTFTSASTVRSLLRAMAEAHLPLRRALDGAAVVAIGPATARALRRSGVRHVEVPDGQWTVEGLVGAVVRAVRHGSTGSP